jgi:hypothetical protein
MSAWRNVNAGQPLPGGSPVWLLWRKDCRFKSCRAQLFMKKKTKQKTRAVPLKTMEERDDELRSEIHYLIDETIKYAANAAMWPLTSDEQAVFVRKTMFYAMRVHAMPQYHYDGARIKCKRL